MKDVFRALRWPVDFAACYAAFLAAHSATGSMGYGFLACGLVGVYGTWCFADGAA